MATPNKNPQNTRLVLFFSYGCPFSRALLKELVNRDLREKFMLINIDTNPSRPTFVDRVPLVFDRATRVIYVDQNIDILVAKMMASKNMIPYTDIKCSGELCFLDEMDTNGDNGQSSTTFSTINDIENQVYESNSHHVEKMPDPVPLSDLRSTRGAVIDIERFNAERNQELDKIKEYQQRGPHPYQKQQQQQQTQQYQQRQGNPQQQYQRQQRQW